MSKTNERFTQEEAELLKRAARAFKRWWALPPNQPDDAQLDEMIEAVSDLRKLDQ